MLRSIALLIFLTTLSSAAIPSVASSAGVVVAKVGLAAAAEKLITPKVAQTSPLVPQTSPLVQRISDRSTTASAPVLAKVDPTHLRTSFGLDQQLWSAADHRGDRQALLTAIDYSLDYLATPEATTAYQNYPIRAFTRDRVRRSLERFRQLVETTRSASALRSAVLQEFDLYQSIGFDGQGTVHFTGYFEPSYAASRTRTAEFRYPLYRLPADLNTWTKPHPTRAQLEGADGLGGSQGRLRGLEIAWLRDRFEAFLVQVQGSARLQLTDGTTMTIGYAGRTDYPYISIGRELVNDGKMRLEDVTKQSLVAYFQQNPSELDVYLSRNDRFVFFRETDGAPPIGTFQVPVTAERSIATDKSLMPPAALALIHTEIPDRQLTPRLVDRYVLNQDTGGAIRGAGRVDIFIGSGQLAGERAGVLNADGGLYYLLLKE